MQGVQGQTPVTFKHTPCPLQTAPRVQNQKVLNQTQVPTVHVEYVLHFVLVYLHVRKTPAPQQDSILTLVGDRGCGKTAVVANWVQRFSEEHADVTVFAHYVGASCVSVDVGHILRRCAKEMRGDYQPPGSCEFSSPPLRCDSQSEKVSASCGHRHHSPATNQRLMSPK